MDDVVKISVIEGENLNVVLVWLLIVCWFGVDIGVLVLVDWYVEGVVDMVFDVMIYLVVLVIEVWLFGWYVVLFLIGYLGLLWIMVGGWCLDVSGLMQVVFGLIGWQCVYFEVLLVVWLMYEIGCFFVWFNVLLVELLLIWVGFVYLWFVMFYLFDDGNGCIVCVFGDLVLVCVDWSLQCFYSLFVQIQCECNVYYDVLECIQCGLFDVIEWFVWFLNMLGWVIDYVYMMFDVVLIKVCFWQ